MDTNAARAQVTAHSAGGAPFLFAFGATLAITAIGGCWWPARTTAIVLLFQGNVALPLAFLLERRLGWGKMAPDNPLRPLSVQLAMSQIAALPIALLAFVLAPWSTGAAMAAIGGGHFVPYAWLQRTRAYAVLGGLVSLGAMVITLNLKEDALPWTLGYMALLYWTFAAIVYRRARVLARTDLEMGDVDAAAAA